MLLEILLPGVRKLQLDISSLKENKGKSIEFRFEEIFAPLELGGEIIAFSKPVIIKGTATNVESGILVECSIETEVTVNCNRCLQPVHFSMHLGVIEEFLEEKAESRQDKASEKDYNTYKGSILDIRNVIEENILLNVPMKTLCSDACKGICSICGADLNVSECSCIHEDIDPRMEKLRDWFPE